MSDEQKSDFKTLNMPYSVLEYINYRERFDVKVYNFTKSKNQKAKKNSTDEGSLDGFLISYNDYLLEYLKKDFLSKSYFTSMKRLDYLMDEPLRVEGKKLDKKYKQAIKTLKELDEIRKNLTEVSKNIKKAELELDDEYRDLSNEELDELIIKAKAENAKAKDKLAEKEDKLAEKVETLKLLKEQKKNLLGMMRSNGIKTE